MIIFIIFGVLFLNNFYWLILLRFLILWFKYFNNKRYLILSMLCLEVNIILTLFLYIQRFNYFSSTLIIIFLTVSVAEAVIGLALIIYISRYKDTEILQIN